METVVTLPIGGLARPAGVNIETIRYYEREGLLPTARRTISGRRTYRPEDSGTLEFIKRSRELGFSLQDVRELLKLRSEENCQDVVTIWTKHLANVRARMADLAKTKAKLARLADCCQDGRTENCDMLKVLEGAPEPRPRTSSCCK